MAVVAVGDDYTNWEGYKDAATGETKIGLSYAKLCQYLKPGHIILLSDGTITIKVRAYPGAIRKLLTQRVYCVACLWLHRAKHKARCIS